MSFSVYEDLLPISLWACLGVFSSDDHKSLNRELSVLYYTIHILVSILLIWSFCSFDCFCNCVLGVAIFLKMLSTLSFHFYLSMFLIIHQPAVLALNLWKQKKSNEL